MQEWDIVVVITTLVGLIGAIVTPIVKLTRAITRLTTAMENVEKNVEDLTVNYRSSHERIWDHEREQDLRLGDHETRIRVIEEER